MNPTKYPMTTPGKPMPSHGPTTGLKVISASELMGAAKAVVIEHQGGRYELRQTRNGKLILTK